MPMPEREVFEAIRGVEVDPAKLNDALILPGGEINERAVELLEQDEEKAPQVSKGPRPTPIPVSARKRKRRATRDARKVNR